MAGQPDRRTAAGAGPDDRDRRQGQVRAGDRRLARNDGRAVQDDADGRHAAAHIERQRIAAAGVRRRCGRSGHTGGRTGIERVDRRIAGMRERHGAAVGARDPDFRRGLQGAQRIGECFEVPGQRGAQDGRRHRRDGPFVVGGFADDVARQGHRQIGVDLAGQCPEGPFVRRVGRRMQQGNRNGLRAHFTQGPDRRPGLRLVERLLHLPARIHPLGDAEGRDDAAGQRTCTLAASEMEHMLESGGDQQADGRSAGLRRIQAEGTVTGRAMNDRRDIAGRHARAVGQFADTGDNRGNRVAGVVGRLQGVRRPRLVEQHQIREGLADIDSQAMGHGDFRHFRRAAAHADNSQPDARRQPMQPAPRRRPGPTQGPLLPALRVRAFFPIPCMLYCRRSSNCKPVDPWRRKPRACVPYDTGLLSSAS